MPLILVADDEPAITDVIAFALQTEGMQTVVCATGGSALHALNAQAFDLLILDIGLPDVNGFDLAKQIRSASALPIIFLTARAGEIDRVVGLELGGDDYVTKPFSPRELSARVKAVLRRTGGENSAVNGTGTPFRIDDAKQQIRFRNQLLELSRTEYRLLKQLLQTPGRVYSREQLMDHAWEHGGYSLERTVDTHIKILRRKLKAVDPEDDSIVTHRGSGYSFREQP